MIRPEATGYGAIYYTCEVFKHQHDDIKGKTFVVSGFGNVAWGAIKKITALGGKALTISGPDGYVYDPDVSPRRRRSIICWRCGPPVAIACRTMQTNSAQSSTRERSLGR